MRQNMGAVFGKCLGQGKDKNGEQQHAEEQQHALSNRYYKNNEVQQRGVSGLKLNKSHLDAFFENTKKSSTDATTQKQLFAKYMNNLFENYSPYSM